MDKSIIKAQYDFKYIVESSSVDINALLLSQIHFTTLINEVHKKLHPNIDLKIRVVAPEKGSFLFQQIFEYAAGGGLLSTNNISYVSNLIML